VDPSAGILMPKYVASFPRTTRFAYTTVTSALFRRSAIPKIRVRVRIRVRGRIRIGLVEPSE